MADIEAEAGALGITDSFMHTFNDGDAEGHARTLAYPHVRLASGAVRIWQSLEEAIPAMEMAFAALRRIAWDHSVWNHRRIVHAQPDKVHLDVQFTRYRNDGSVIGVYPAIYVVVRRGGAWLIQARSSFAP